jgi:hypothetical protein
VFISCACVEALFFVLTLISERYLRHAGRLLPNWRQRERVMAVFAIGFGTIGQLAIIMVSVFNTNVFPAVHVSMLILFLVAIALSAIFTFTEFTLLDRSYSGVKRLRISYSLKALWFIVSLGLVIGFGVCARSKKRNVAAALEWALAFTYGFYLLTLLYDLAPAASTRKGQLLEEKVSNQLVRVASWIPGSGVIPEEPSINPIAEIKERESSQLGDLVLGHRRTHSPAAV